MTIAIREVTKSFHDFIALDNVSLTVEEGEILALLGPSGSGKTTLLRIIAGLESEDSGQVLFFDQDMAGVSVRDRKVGFVFQHYALFRHMSVFDNVAFGLKVRRDRPPKKEIERRVLELLHLVQLDPFADRRPNQLSGGQRQRVALARALAIEPKVLLLDEPFGALDAQVRKDLRRWLRRLHDDIGVTSVFVTHDQDEALEIADRVVVMSHGKIEQIASPTEVYDAPATPFVFEFIGGGNRIAAVVRNGALDASGVPAPIPAGVVLSDGQAVDLFVRPSDLALAPAATGDAAPAWAGTVRHLARLGPLIRAQVATPFGMMEAETSREAPGVEALTVGSPILLRPRRLWLFDRGAAVRLDA